MKPIETPRYRAREFATLTGVTVRTLHFYDRLGLLQPRRTQAGHRLYGQSDLDALRLIRVLKFIGLPLKKIKVLMRGDRAPLAEALRGQRGILQARRAQLDQAIVVLANVERLVESHQPIDGRLLQRIIDTIQPQGRTNLMKRYTSQLTAKIDRLKANLGRTRQFADLCLDVEDALTDDPSSAKAQELATRWMELGVDPISLDPLMIMAARGLFREAFQDARDVKPFVPRLGNPAVAEFIQKAIAARVDATKGDPNSWTDREQLD